MTEQDRETAMRAFSEWITFRAADGGLSIGQASDDERIDAIAEALAEERKKARAPFLALADDLERYADEWEADGESVAADVLMDSAERVRRAAEDVQ